MKDLAFPRHGAIARSVIVVPDPDWKGPAEAALTDLLRLAWDRSVPAFVSTNPWFSSALYPYFPWGTHFKEKSQG